VTHFTREQGRPVSRVTWWYQRLGHDRRVTVVSVCIVVALVAAVSLVIVLRPDPGVGEKLASSLVDEGDGFTTTGPCEPQGAARWLCEIEDDPRSGGSDLYRLKLDANGCWAGARTVDVPGGQPLSGCI
jgi:hypothetical protein